MTLRRHRIHKADHGKFRLGLGSRSSKTQKRLWAASPLLQPVRIRTKRSTPMFARILNFEVKPEKKEEFVKVVKNEVLPILRKQTGFLEILPFFPEKMKEEKAISISLWATKQDAERYE